jgi:hypothetical protein
MPPRYAYWTILVDDQPTAFRAGAKEDLLPTFNRLKEKQPSAVMKWFQNGKLWDSRIDAQEAMRARGEMGRRGDERQAGSGFRDRERRPARERGAGTKRTAWTPRGEPATPAPARNADQKLDWKPKGEFTPAPKRSERPDWKPKGSFDREATREWKPKSQAPSPRSSDWKPKSFKRPDFKRSGDDSRPAKPEWKPKGSFDREARSFDRKPARSFDREAKREWKPRPQAPGPKTRLEWTPKSDQPTSQAPGPKSPEKRKWVPKAEYKKSQGIEAKKDKNWRPGGEHKDPRQKYKDAKKAKWTKFKKTIRTKWEAKGKKKS